MLKKADAARLVTSTIFLTVAFGCGQKCTKISKPTTDVPVTIGVTPVTQPLPPVPVEKPADEKELNEVVAVCETKQDVRFERAKVMPKRAMTLGYMSAAGCAYAPAVADMSVTRSYNTEEYEPVDESGYKLVTSDPLSTFSIDVDVASYANIRRFIAGNSLPPKDAVRIEEMINYFTYEYPAPRGEEPFSITTEMSACPWNRDRRLVMIGIQGREIETAFLPPFNLVFLLDVSGSMNSPDKLPLLKTAMKMLAGNLRPQDRVALTVYAGAAGCVLPSTPGSNRQEILDAIDRLEAGGSTAGAEGIELAYDVARRNFIPDGNNRVILATDGDFNVGVSSDAELVRMIERKREAGIFLTVLGFGTGNYKDAKMEKLADRGNGNYAYIDNMLEAKKVLVSEMGGTLVTIAKDVKIQVEFNPAAVAAYRLIGYENRRLNNEDFNDDKKDAGELGSGHTVTALYEIVPAGAPFDAPAVDPLKYRKPAAAVSNDKSEMLTVKFRYKEPQASHSRLIVKTLKNGGADSGTEDLRFAAAVAGFGMMLRDSEHKGNLSWDAVLEMGRAAKGTDAHGYRAEFLRLVEQAKLLAKGRS